MVHRHSPLTSLLVAGLSVVAVAGCTSDSASPSTASSTASPGSSGDPTALSPLSTNATIASLGSTATPGSIDPSDSTPSTVTTDSTVQLSPLELLLGPGQSAEISPDHDRQVAAEIEGKIAACMAAEGFRYTPIRYNFALQPFTASYSHEFRAQYGFGISAQPPSVATPSPDVQLEAMTAGLDVATKRAFYAALDGNDAPTINDDGTIVRQDGSTQTTSPGETPDSDRSCIGEAYGPAIVAPEITEDFSELEAELAALTARVDADPQTTAAAETYSSCMADAGYPALAKPSDAPSIASDRLASITVDGVANPDDLPQVQRDEVTLALTDEQCAAPYDAIRASVRADIEEAFIADHRDILDRYAESGASEPKG